MAHPELTYIVSVFTGFFAIMNPIANTTIFLSLTDGISDKDKKLIAYRSTFIAFLITSCFVVMGNLIFRVFDITIPAFKITGGVLLFYVGFGMLESKSSYGSSTVASDDVTSIAVSPLAIPILAGPGTLVTGINFVSDGSWIHILLTISVYAFICWVTYLCFQGADKIVSYLGKNLISVFGKIMGLILAVMGVDMVINGIKLAFLK
ncbi:MarC family protein [Halosquirtibacter xylanolyticus]|uniref:MarC family protein n=1 Tax=Halosquirtibacter xylanolyticus TaxID=3374599 RepID=UPI003748986A|nr:MarC family protein [Prolixibacteraceae bacterium]